MILTLSSKPSFKFILRAASEHQARAINLFSHCSRENIATLRSILPYFVATMLFGFRAGDFVAITKLTLQLYRSFKGATGEFDEISAS